MIRHHVYRCLTCGFVSRPMILALVVAVNVLHPLLHSFEGGGMDAFLVYLDGFALQVDPHIPEVKR